MATRRKQNAGLTLIEVTIALAILSTIMVFMTVSLQREARGLREVQSLSFQERTVQDLLTKIEQHLDFAQGSTPEALLASALPGTETFVVDVDETGAFPDVGVLIIEPNSPNEERVAYGDMDPVAGALLTLQRGQFGTTASSHPLGSTVLWAGAATVLEEQNPPPVGTFDGTSREMLRDLAFKGSGTGFSYRIPVDPAGGTDYMTATGVRWGAEVGGRPTEDGRACIYFEPVAVVTEAARNFDFNQDGDQNDTFDLGRIRQRAWDAADGANASSDLPLCPPMILQEQDAWGSDLDNDGFQDPIFLFDPASGRLRIRFFAIVGSINSRQVVKRYETVLHLRNGSAD